MRAFHHPAMTPQLVVAFDAPTSNAALDATLPEMLAAACKVIAFVGMQLVGPAARSAALAGNAGHGIYEFLEHHRVMSIGARDAEHQWDALPVRDEMAFAAELAPVGRVEARVRAPRGLDTLAPSKLTRLKSSRPAPHNSASNSKCSWCHTPAACHSRSLRQQVMPLPKPSSWGRYSQGVPVRSTNRMPLSANSSLSRGRPPRGDFATSGNSGCIRDHSAAFTSFLTAIYFNDSQTEENDRFS